MITVSAPGTLADLLVPAPAGDDPVSADAFAAHLDAAAGDATPDTPQGPAIDADAGDAVRTLLADADAALAVELGTLLAAPAAPDAGEETPAPLDLAAGLDADVPGDSVPAELSPVEVLPAAPTSSDVIAPVDTVPLDAPTDPAPAVPVPAVALAPTPVATVPPPADCDADADADTSDDTRGDAESRTDGPTDPALLGETPRVAPTPMPVAPAATPSADTGPVASTLVSATETADGTPASAPVETAAPAPVAAAPTSTPVVTAVPAPAPAPVGVAPVAAPEAPAPVAPTATPLLEQMRAPVAAIRTLPTGTHVVTVHVTPDELGPVTVRAVVADGALDVQLSVATDAARDALRALLPDLRRDLSGGGSAAQLQLADPAADRGADRGAEGGGTSERGTADTANGGARDRRDAGSGPDQPTPASSPLDRTGHSALDVLA